MESRQCAATTRNQAESINKALQWSGERKCKNYVNQTELTSEMNLQCNYFALVERHFPSKNN